MHTLGATRRGEYLAPILSFCFSCGACIGFQMTYSWFSMIQISVPFHTFGEKKTNKSYEFSWKWRIENPLCVPKCSFSLHRSLGKHETKKKMLIMMTGMKKTIYKLALTESESIHKQLQQQQQIRIRVNKFPHASKTYLSWSHTYHNNFFPSSFCSAYFQW